MKKYSFLIICTLLTGLLFTTCEPWIVPEAVFVNFNANGGQGDMKALRFMDGEKQSLTKNSYTRNGYIFDGWNTRSDGRGQSYTDRQNVSITKSVTLYAQWKKIYKVTFNANGGTGTMSAQTFEAGVSQALAANTFTRSGYTFTGWNTKVDGSGTAYTDRQSITLSQDITLYAQWKKDIVNYTLTFNANGGTGTMAAQTFEAGVSQAIAANAFTRSGYTFTGWNTKADGSGNSYTDGQEIALSQDITLYAQWKKDIVNYTVTFNANGGTGTMAAQTFEGGVSQAIAANAFTRSGYTFTGWNTKADGSGTAYTDRQSITLSQNITLYAQWKKDIVNYTVTFNANGGTGTMAAQTFEAGVSQAIAANAFTRSGYTFTGWNTKADGSGTSYTDGQEITLSQDITLYAQWYQEQVVSGTENGHDYVDLGLPSGALWATCNVGATTPEGYGDYFAWGETEPKTNYDFSTYKYCKGSSNTMTKYCTKSSYGYNGFTDGKTTLDLSDDAARANWGGTWRMPTYAELDELRNNCTWTWRTQNGVNGYKVTSKTNGNSIFLPAAGYSYDGTSVSYVGSQGSYWSSSLQEKYPYYACHLSLHSDNDVYLSSYYRFSGHSVRAVFSDNDKPSTFVTLTFNANGGSGTMAAQTFEAGVSQAIKANTFTRSGYTFTGWNTAANGSGTSYTDKQSITLSQDITLYAQWESAGGSGGGSSTSGTENGHDYVDLGLPSGLKWATCNVGATSPVGYGDYFAWGETEPKTNYDWSTYKYCNGSSSTLTKYNTDSRQGSVDNKTTLDLSDDAARANWGGAWRMPTTTEQEELINNCTWTWSTQNGVRGYKVTSKTNGNSIFLPAAGLRSGTSVRNVGSYGNYWSSSLNEKYPYYAYILDFDSGYVDWLNSYRHLGLPVRAVCP